MFSSQIDGKDFRLKRKIEFKISFGKAYVSFYEIVHRSVARCSDSREKCLAKNDLGKIKSSLNLMERREINQVYCDIKDIKSSKCDC